MPIYEYHCDDCGKVSEVMVGIGRQSDSLQCKHCGGTALSKLPTLASFVTSPSRPSGRTCCGKEERCDKPPCSTEGTCSRD
ncbi:MAG: zinc ribbon domain-containing protein [Deltaproteobacteria bacterium]|nr:MAG: zinc ribbon domain-containing protein [Deltaproteobacteria bacterium]